MSQVQQLRPPAAEQGERTRRPVVRRWTGLLLGLVLGIVVYLILPDSLATEARATAGIGILMAVWWMTEAIPLPSPLWCRWWRSRCSRSRRSTP